MLAGGSSFTRAYPLSMESKAGSKLLFHRASFPENRIALFRTHFGEGNGRLQENQGLGTSALYTERVSAWTI